MLPPQSADFRSRFAGIARLLGAENFAKIAGAHICIVGLGGVGSWTCEALARSGICEMTLVDADTICATNTNRQLHALDGNFGRSKAETLAARVRAINPDCRVRAVQMFIDRADAPDFFKKIADACGNDENSENAEICGNAAANGAKFDLVIDAIDGAMNKAALIAACVAAGTPVVSSGGCGGRRDGLHVESADLADAQGDALLRIVRRELRSRYGFAKGNSGVKKLGVPVVFSREEPHAPELSAEFLAAFPQIISPAGGKPRAGTAAFVTGAFGLALAQLAVEKILEK